MGSCKAKVLGSPVSRVLLCTVGMLLFVMSSRGHATPPSCKDCIKDLEFKKMDLHYQKIHDSRYLEPGASPMRTLAEVNNTTPQFVHIVKEEIGKFACPNQKPNGLIHPSQLNSTCPWYFLKNTDSNRYPEIIWEASCACENCLDFNEDGKRTKNACKGVYYNARVLRRTQCGADGYYVYETIAEPIRTGCMCTSAWVQDSQTTKPTLSPEKAH